MYYSRIHRYLLDLLTVNIYVSGESKMEEEFPGPSSVHSEKGAVTEVPAPPPIRLGDYEVVSSRSNRIGKGGFGSVFIGKDTRTNDAVAVKIAEIDEKTITYIDRESRLLRACKHKNIIEVFHIQQKNNELYIVMEYCSNGNLNQYVETNSITYETGVSFMEDMTTAVNFLHNEAKVYHRDIKPDNVLISDAIVAKLADFGLAKEFRVSSSIASGSAVGSFHWMSPEMIEGHSKYGFAVDIFPLGLLLLAMVTLLPKRGSLHPITSEYPDTQAIVYNLKAVSCVYILTHKLTFKQSHLSILAHETTIN